MTKLWMEKGLITPGGTVIAGAIDEDENIWVATPTGIWCREQSNWRRLPDQPLVPFLQAFAYADGFAFLGNANEVLFSMDNGRHWNKGQTVALETPITCFAVSPNFAHDRLVLAGTDGQGILRSTDGGRHWDYCSFGLKSPSVINLVAAQTWGEREVMFAATLNGLYRSSNGGRAWKPANDGLENCNVVTIAPSPSFANDGVVLVGTESNGIYRSSNSGKDWCRCNFPTESGSETPCVNVLWVSPNNDYWLAGLDDGQILRSLDNGNTWETVTQMPASVLCFFAQDRYLYTGMSDAGLMYTIDEGSSWQADTSFAARQFARLFSLDQHTLFSYGAAEGILQSNDVGETWNPGNELSGVFLTAAAAPSDVQTLLAATSEGLFRSDDMAGDWQLVLSEPDITSLHFSPDFHIDQRVWAGGWSGNSFISSDGGHQWQKIIGLPTTNPIICIGIFNPRNQPEQLLLVTFQAKTQVLTLWAMHEDKWHIWLESPSTSPNAAIAQTSADSDEILVSLGTRCWHWHSGQWHCVLKCEKPVMRLVTHPDGGIIALTSDDILYSPDLKTFLSLNRPTEAELRDVALLSDGETLCIYALEIGGRLFHAPCATLITESVCEAQNG